MKRIMLPVLILFSAIYANGQDTLTIADCYERAGKNYPLIKQKELIEKSRAFSVENASRGHLPQVSIGGQATYQSEVTQIPVEMPGVEPLSKDQYKVFADISQNLYQGGLVRQQKELEEVNSDIEQQKISVDLYQIKNRINELFFGILLIQEQRRQNELVKQDIGSGLKKTRTAIANGVALRSAADVLEAELLRAEEGNIELASAERSYKNILGLFIDSAVNDNSVLEKPLINIQGGNVTRPELTLLNYQKHGIEVNRAVLSARKKPRFDLFVQGGYGRPGLNMLENEFNLYYLGGVRFSWSLSGFYTFTREKQILTLKEQSLDVQKETFLFNTSLSLNQYEAEIAKLQRLLLVDDEIIKLQTRIKETASVQLEAGVISPTDYIRELNSEDQAKQNRVLHETQLLMAKAKYQFNRGN